MFDQPLLFLYCRLFSLSFFTTRYGYGYGFKLGLHRSPTSLPLVTLSLSLQCGVNGTCRAAARFCSVPLNNIRRPTVRSHHAPSRCGRDNQGTSFGREGGYTCGKECNVSWANAHLHVIVLFLLYARIFRLPCHSGDHGGVHGDGSSPPLAYPYITVREFEPPGGFFYALIMRPRGALNWTHERAEKGGCTGRM